MPIVRAWRAIQRRGDYGATALIALIALYFAVSLFTPVVKPLQRGIMAAHHMRPDSMPAWAFFQLAPKMYGVAHRVWRGPIRLFDPKRDRQTAERAFVRTHFWVNHYPARLARYDGYRQETFGDGATIYVYLRSTYRGEALESAFTVRASDGTLHLRLEEDL